MINQPNSENDHKKSDIPDAYITAVKGSENSDWSKKKLLKKRKAVTKKVISITSVTLASVLIAVTAAFFTLKKIGKNKLTTTDVNIETTENIDSIIYNDSTLLYNGELYEYNTDITGIIMMGIDRSKLTESETYGKSGQADTIMLITVDTKTGKTVVTGIPRDTVCDVDIYSSSGNFSETVKTQLCLAYAYGDGKSKSCENTAKSVSKLLMGMPINSYFSADYDLVKKFNDSLGGIEITPNDTFSYGGYNFKKDVPVILKGDKLISYLCYRGDNADSSYLRMERQINYLKLLTEKFTEKTKNDISFPLKTFNTFSKNSTSNLTVDKITTLSSAIFSNKNDISIDFKKIEGKQIIGESGYAEFYPDETELFELILELFYVKSD